MSPSRGDGDEPLGAAAAASAGASTATEEAGLPSVPAPAFEGWQPPGEQQRQQRPRWLRWALGRVGGGLLLVAVLVAAIVLGVTLRAGGGGRSKGAATTGPGPGGTGEGGAVLPSTVTGLDAAKQQQPPPPPPEGSVGNRNGTAAGGSPPQIATAPPGKGQAAGAAATLNELAKQLLGEGGVNPGLGGGILEGEEEDEAEDSFIAVEGCTPHNYPELHFLVERSSCPVITLVPGIFYNFTEYIVVRRPVAIVGRPLNPPTLDAHLAYRAFLVEAGGVLDLRHVVVYRGKPIEVIAPQLYFEVRGAVAYIRNGGTGFFTDCVMVLHEDTVTEFLITPMPQTTVRINGGFLLLESGTLHVVGCHILVQRPGVLFREVYTVGGFILVVQGTLLLTGSTLTATFLFITVFGLGNFLCVVGGNAVVTGTVFTLNGGFVASQGAGLLQFIGGGTSTFTGSVSQGNLGFLSFFGAGLGLFTGGGVSILTGVAFSSVSAMNFGAGLGFNNGLGGGVMVKTGVVQSGAHSQSALAVLGVATFVGAGTVVYSETAWNRNTALTAFYGAGGSLYLGSGVATVVNSVSMGVTGTVYAASAGGDHAIFAGWLTMVNSWFFKWVAIAVYYGQGVDTCLCAGGALLVHCGYTGIPPIVHVSPNLYNIYVAGKRVVLNKTTDVVLVTHKTYRVNGQEQRQRQRERERRRRLAQQPQTRPDLQLLPPSLRALNLTGGVRVVDGVEAAARLELRRVTWEDASPELFKRAFKESAQEGTPAQWPWRLRALMAGEGEEPQKQKQQQRRAGRRAQEEKEEEEEAAQEQGQAPQGQEQEAVAITATGEAADDAALVPLYPGSPVLIPRAEPRPSEGPGALSRVYVASPLERCRACGVRPSADSGTSEAFAGVGAEGCEFSEACAADEAGDEEDESGGIMWMVAPGSGRMPNTSLAVVNLMVSSSSSSSSSGPEPQQVLRAVNRTILSLGLGTRYHLRVVPGAVPLPYDTHAERGLQAQQQPHQQQEEMQDEQPPDTAESSSSSCSLRVPFRAYLVSDRAPVISALAKGLRQPAAAAAMTAALQEESQAAAVCGLRATRAVQTFMPGLNASAFVLQQQPAAAGAPKGGAMATATTGIARLLAAAGKTRPTRTVLFGDGVEQKQQGRALGAAAEEGASAAARELHPTAALLLRHDEHDDNEGEEEADGARATEVRHGETYALALGRFPHGRRLRVRLVPAAGKGALLGVVHSAPRGEGGRQAWAWTVDHRLAPGKYFFEVASDARDAFAYSQAFEVVG